MNYLKNKNLKKFIFCLCSCQIIVITTASNIFAGEGDKKFNEFYQKDHIDIDHNSDYNNYLNTSYNLYSNTAQNFTSYNNYHDFYSLYNLDLDYSYFVAQASILPALSLPMANYKIAAIFVLPVLSIALYNSLENLKNKILTYAFNKSSQNYYNPNNNLSVLFQETDETKETKHNSLAFKLQSLGTKTYDNLVDFIVLMDKNSAFFDQNDPHIKLIHDSLSGFLTEHKDYKTNPKYFLNSISRKILARYLHYLDKSKILFTQIDIDLILDKFSDDWLKQVIIDKNYSSLIFIDKLLIKKYKDFFSTWYVFFLTDYFDSYKKANIKVNLTENHLDYAQNEKILTSNRLSKLALLDHTVHKSLNASDDHKFLKKQLVNTAKHYLSNARFKYLARIITRAALYNFVHPLKGQKHSVEFPLLSYESKSYRNNLVFLYKKFGLNFELLDEDESPKRQSYIIFNSDQGIAKISMLSLLQEASGHFLLHDAILALNITPDKTKKSSDLQNKKDMDLIYLYPLVEEYMIIDWFHKVTSIDKDKPKKVENPHHYSQEKLVSAGVLRSFIEDDDNNFQFIPLNSGAYYEHKQLEDKKNQNIIFANNLSQEDIFSNFYKVLDTKSGAKIGFFNIVDLKSKSDKDTDNDNDNTFVKIENLYRSTIKVQEDDTLIEDFYRSAQEIDALIISTSGNLGGLGVRMDKIINSLVGTTKRTQYYSDFDGPPSDENQKVDYRSFYDLANKLVATIKEDYDLDSLSKFELAVIAAILPDIKKFSKSVNLLQKLPIILIVDGFTACAGEMLIDEININSPFSIVIGRNSMGSNSTLSVRKKNGLEMRFDCGINYNSNGHCLMTEPVIPDILLPSIFSYYNECIPYIPQDLAEVRAKGELTKSLALPDTDFGNLKSNIIKTLKEYSDDLIQNDQYFKKAIHYQSIYQNLNHNLDKINISDINIIHALDNDFSEVGKFQKPYDYTFQRKLYHNHAVKLAEEYVTILKELNVDLDELVDR